MRKKKLLCLGISIALLLVGCRGKHKNEEAEGSQSDDCQTGFTGAMGNPMCESEDGYYFLIGNYLVFADRDLEKTTVVCNKPECLHQKEDSENKENCNAYFLSPESVSYSQEKLYVLVENPSYGEGGQLIFEVALDGRSKKSIYSGKEEVHMFCTHRGNMYVQERSYKDEDGAVSENSIVTITKFPIDQPKKTEELFRNEEYKDGTVNRLECIDNYCYFNLFGMRDQGEEDILQRINLDTGEVEILGERGAMAITSDSIFKSQYGKDAGEKLVEMFRCTIDGKVEKQFTEDKLTVLKSEDFIFAGADERYLYFQEYPLGERDAEKEKIDVYTHEGELVCEIGTGEIEQYPQLYVGNDKYLFLEGRKESKGDGAVGEKVWYCIEKEKMKAGKAKIQEILRLSLDEYQ